MKRHLLLFCSLISLNIFAVDIDQCDKNSPIDRHQISTPQGDIEALVCHQGEDVLVLTDAPVVREHLFYAGANIGMPYLLGAGLTYSQLKNGKQNFHISATQDASLGANGVSVIYGKHPFGNSLFYGGIARGYQGLPGEGGFQMGPTVGLSGGKKFITAHVSLSFVEGYDSRVGGLTGTPEISMGLRIRLFKK